MSYATVAATNAPPPSQQPHANPALLNTGRSPNLAPVDAHNEKVQLAGPGFKEHPSTVTSHGQAEKDKHRRDKAKEHLHRAEQEAETAWEYAKTQILRPGVAGGVLGIVNVGLLATAGYQFYTRPELRSDKRAIGGTVAGALVLFGAEGWLAESYAQTEAGQREAQRAKEEGALLWRHTKEVVLRPGVLGGLVGALNVGILGGLGYTFYSRPELQNDRRFISWATIGVLSLFAGEGFVAEHYRK